MYFKNIVVCSFFDEGSDILSTHIYYLYYNDLL